MMYQSFRDKFLEIANKPGLLRRLTNTVSSWIYGDSSIEESVNNVHPSPALSQPIDSSSSFPDKSILLIRIYAEDKTKVQKTEERLQRMIDEQFTNDKVADELVCKLSNKQKEDLKKKAMHRNVEIVIESGKELTT